MAQSALNDNKHDGRAEAELKDAQAPTADSIHRTEYVPKVPDQASIDQQAANGGGDSDADKLVAEQGESALAAAGEELRPKDDTLSPADAR